MSPLPRECILAAMRCEDPGVVPVFSPLSVGHYLLHSGVDPVSFHFTHDGYAQALLSLRERYDFDGLLISNPGREEQVLELTRLDLTPQGPALYFADGGCLVCAATDEPRFIPPAPWSRHGFARPEGLDPVSSLEAVDPAAPLAGLPESCRAWARHQGLLDALAPDEIPQECFVAIDQICAAAAGRFSVHGEVNAPLQYLFHWVGFKTGLQALSLAPERCHHLLMRAAQTGGVWAAAQIRHGCDAVRLYSPYSGAGFLSRETYAEFVVPYERYVATMIKAAGGFAYTASGGAFGDRLDLLASTGVDGLESLDLPPLGNITLAAAKRGFGDRLFFKGNIDSDGVLLCGDERRVHAATRRCLAEGAPGGGFILSSTCAIPAAVPPENVRIMVETARAWAPAD